MTLFSPQSTPGLESIPGWSALNTLDASSADPLARLQTAHSHQQSPLLDNPEPLDALAEGYLLVQGEVQSAPRDRALTRSIPRTISTQNKGLTQTISGKNQRVLGTNRNDRLDASKGQGRNRLLGKGGNDRLKGKQNDRLMGGSGRDRLDTRKGRKNILKGGGGNDILFPGKRDTVFGNGGADRLDASKGRGRNTLNGGGGSDVLIGKMGDRLVGGGGNDEFVLINRTLPTQPLIVQDFQQGRDRLSLRNAPDGLSVSDLKFRQQGQNTVIVAQGQDIAILENVTANQLTIFDFVDTASEAPAEFIPLPTPSGTSSLLPDSLAGPPATPPEVLPIVEDNNDGNARASDSATGSRNRSTVMIQQQNQYSITSLNASDVLLRFNLSGLDASNTFIPDRNSDPNVGVFPDAIQEYVSGNGTLPFGVTAVPFAADGQIAFDTVDLRAELVQDASRNAFITNGRNTIEYVFTNPNQASNSSAKNNPSTTGQTNELLRLSLDFTSNFLIGTVPNFDLHQAINSIEYIVENDLLAQATRVQVAGTQLFTIGNVQNTQPSRTYRQPGNAQFRLVGSQQNLSIQDQNSSANAGFFEKAIEDFQDELTGQSISVGNLSASLDGSRVTYAIAQSTPNNTPLKTATLDLTGTTFDPTLAVNNLPYILTNDLLKLAFLS
ncbi:MAG: calcium-binding protein [Cyanobacteria bacterium P01_F01_bin.150]